MSIRHLLVFAVTALLVLVAVPLTAQPTLAATYSVRLEAGPQTGYRFSSTGTILGRKTVTLAAPATATADSRSAVPNQPGTYFRITAGQFAGYRMRESLIAHIPGTVGEWITKLMPGNAGSAVATVVPFNPDALGPWTGFGVFCLEVAVVLGVAGWLFVHRDA